LLFLYYFKETYLDGVEFGLDQDMVDGDVVTEDLMLEVKSFSDLQDWDRAASTVIAEGPPADM
jgi:hypothetical protein